MLPLVEVVVQVMFILQYLMVTGGFASGQNNPEKAGEAGQNAKIVFQGILPLITEDCK